MTDWRRGNFAARLPRQRSTSKRFTEVATNTIEIFETFHSKYFTPFHTLTCNYSNYFNCLFISPRDTVPYRPITLGVCCQMAHTHIAIDVGVPLYDGLPVCGEGQARRFIKPGQEPTCLKCQKIKSGKRKPADPLETAGKHGRSVD